MANTFELIASYTASGSVSSIDFSSIPATYTDLCLKISARGDTSAIYFQNKVRFNGAGTDANLTYRNVYGSGSGVASQNSTIGLIPDSVGDTATASTFSNTEIYIPNYSGSAYKSYSADGVSENNATGAYAYLIAGLWSSTAAINQITLVPFSGNYKQYTTAYLYGVKNA